jgi:hypothetical protein
MAISKMKEWMTYEEVAKHLLNQFKSEFGLQAVEGKQHLVGIETGTEWEVDAKGVADKESAFVIIEARRYTTSKQNQEKIAGLAYRIQDTGAKGGIIVSPLGLQEGASKVAKANNIVSVKISANSTPEQFSIEFFGNLLIGTGTAKLKLKTYPATIETKENP